MRGKLDENMPSESVAILQSAGWQCATVHDEALGGAEESIWISPTSGRILQRSTKASWCCDRSNRDSILRLLERAMPADPEGWLVEIAAAYQHAHEAQLFGPAVGKSLAASDLFYVTPLVALKFRGIDCVAGWKDGARAAPKRHGR